jgi:protease-4
VNEDTFSGLIWSGERALDLGLVDAYGTTRSVARELEAERVVDFTPQTDFLQQIADLVGSSVGRGISQYLLGNFSLN